MRYEVPQFIEIEDKIIGPLTWKQFVFLAGGLLGSLGIWLLLPSVLSVILVIPLITLALALAFYKHNKRSFMVLLEAWCTYTVRSKLYIWKKRSFQESQRSIVDEVESIVGSETYIPRISDSKLKDLSWSLDINRQYSNTEVL